MKKKIMFFVLLIMFIFIFSRLELLAFHDRKMQIQPKMQIDKDDTDDTYKTVLRRFAMVVGANNGGRGRVKLQYAIADAKSILKVLEDMGGVSPDDSRLLIEPNRETFFWEVKRLRDRIKRARADHRRVEVILYYSGHSDEKNILLGKEKVSYKDFKDEITRMDADVRIAILDSCASGAFTLLKGGKKKAPFLVDTAYDMKGYAFITSSSSDEASQESARLEGSFFTHYFTSGLRGAADMSQDGKVTLNEAYQFAFNETLAQTTETVSGPQHPNCNIQMSGKGDVVMTEIGKSSALLRISKNVSGRLFIHNQQNVLVVELNKPLGRSIELGMDAGKYRIINIVEGNIFETKIHLPKGKSVELDIDQFYKSKKIDTVARGDLNARSRRTVLQKRGKSHIYAGISTKSTSINGDTAVLMGFHLGLTFRQRFSVGFAGYGKVNMPPGLPGYGGVTVEYSFNPWKKFHYKVGALMGSGTGDSGIFYLFEPEVKLVMNLSQTVRIGLGISIPITDNKSTGLKNPSLALDFQFGK
jgi:hypothetical protein